jgi:hypothetical protein
LLLVIQTSSHIPWDVLSHRILHVVKVDLCKVTFMSSSDMEMSRKEAICSVIAQGCVLRSAKWTRRTLGSLQTFHHPLAWPNISSLLIVNAKVHCVLWRWKGGRKSAPHTTKLWRMVVHEWIKWSCHLFEIS